MRRLGPGVLRSLDALEQLVTIETPSGHAPGLLAAFELIRSWVAPVLGSDGTVPEHAGVPHLLCEASGDPHVLLLGHADTVWPLGTLATRPFAVARERATGPGVLDMKGGLVIAVEALRLAGDVSHVGLLVTGDEEAGSATSRALIEHVARRYRSVLLLEPSADGAVKTARKGVGLYRLEVTGRAAHAGLEPANGVNALSELARLIVQIESLAATDPDTTVTPTVAHAGVGTNTVPDRARLDVDVRGWSADELERVDRELRRLGVRHPAATLRVQGGINRLPMEPALSRGLLQVARRVSARLDLGPIAQARVGGGSDGNFTTALGIATLDGLGAIGGGAHARDEWITVDSLSTRARLVAGMLDELRD